MGLDILYDKYTRPPQIPIITVLFFVIDSELEFCLLSWAAYKSTWWRTLGVCFRPRSNSSAKIVSEASSGTDGLIATENFETVH